SNIYLISPLKYQEFVYLMFIAYIIITDSGGIQEEAPSLGKPVLVMRNTTERPEAVEAGVVKLVGISKDKIIDETEKLLENQKEYENMSKSCNPYGNGDACEKIIQIIKERFKV
ncbi:UDP-N-acetylglucosamine 2-epimerase, partial [Helicobacter pullorum]